MNNEKKYILEIKFSKCYLPVANVQIDGDFGSIKFVIDDSFSHEELKKVTPIISTILNAARKAQTEEKE